MNHVSKKYLEITADEGSGRKNEWFEYCRQQRMPYITVVVDSGVADVAWDYISYPIDSEKLFNENCGDICQSLMVIYEKFSTENTQYKISSTDAEFKDVSIDCARRAAVEIYELIDGFFKMNH